MLSEKEQAELDALRRDPDVKRAASALRRQYPKKRPDPEKKKLYQYRWLKKKGLQLAGEKR